MITSIYKTVVDNKNCCTYLICKVRSGQRNRYNLIKIDSACNKMVVLLREVTLGTCLEMIS